MEGERLDDVSSHDAIPEQTGQRHQSGLNGGTEHVGLSAEDRLSADENEDDTEDDAPTDLWHKVPGPLSKEGKQEAQKLGSLVDSEAERIGRKYHKSKREIIMAAGLGVRSARAKNSYNMFMKWYAHHHPRNDHEFTVPHAACD